jgi:DUF4097 and DUF4098 domain-containing protein YvlB
MNRQVLRPLAVPFALLASLVSAGCMVSVDSSEYTAREEKRFDITRGTAEVTLVTFDGSVEVRSWDQAAVQVEIEKRGPNRQVAESIEVRAEQAGSVIRLEVKKPTGETAGFLRQSPSAKLVALVPRQAKVVVRSGDGSITVERVEGDLDLDTSDGSIRGYDLAGRVRIHTGDGSVRLEQVRGSLDVDTGDGTVSIAGRLEGVKVVTGDGTVVVRAEEGSAMADQWEIRTGDGGVRLELPAAFAANLDASTADGRVRLGGMEGVSPEAEPAGEHEDERSRRELRRALGGGGKLLRLRSGSGTITVTGI